MKQLINAYRGVVRGASRGWMVSVLFHLGVFVIAVSVYMVVPKPAEEVIFHPYVVPEPIKMDLIRPTVRIHKQIAPAKQINRIAVKQEVVSQPEYQVPEYRHYPWQPIPGHLFLPRRKHQDRAYPLVQ